LKNETRRRQTMLAIEDMMFEQMNVEISFDYIFTIH